MSFMDRLFGPASPEKFATMVMAELRKRGATSTTFDEDAFAIRIGDARPYEKIFLGNYYALYTKAPRQERRAAVEAPAELWSRRPVGEPVSLADARAKLVPAVRSRAYYDVNRLRLEIEKLPTSMLAPRPFGKHLAIGLVLDYPDSVRPVTEDQLRQWELSAEDAYAIALENLREQSTPSFEKASDGVFVSSWRDSYDASRILIPELAKRLTLRGRPVALLPHRNMLILAGSDDASGLSVMATAAETMFDEPQPMSAWPLIFDGAEWRDWEIASDHSAAQEFKLLQLRRRSLDYDEQKRLLNALLASRNQDIYVASFVATQHEKTGLLSSYTTWTADVDTLLPEAERISFVRVDGDKATGLGWVSWDEVLRRAPGLLQPTEYYPPRYSVSQFPTDAQLASMEKLSL